MPTAIDHLVITAACLAEGERFVFDRLGVAMQPGGQHLRMGTHNSLLRLGDSVYIEVIAVDSGNPRAEFARWFGLDSFVGEPRLAAWVCRTTEIDATIASSPVSAGKIEIMSRGNLTWKITIPAGGVTPFDGLCPYLIEWPAGVHPCQRLPDSGCEFVELQLAHPDAEAFRAHLAAIGVGTDSRIQVTKSERPGIGVTIRKNGKTISLK